MLTILGQLVLAVALAGALWFQTQRLHTAQAERDSARTALRVDEGSINRLQAAVDVQNHMVSDLVAAAAAKEKQAKAALQEAVDREKAQQGTIDGLRRSAALAPAPGAPCVISPALAEAEGL